MLPIVGPSTIRDGAGFAVDAAALSVPSQISNDDVRLAIWGTAVVHGRAQLTGLDGLVTGDGYIFFRDGEGAGPIAKNMRKAKGANEQ